MDEPLLDARDLWRTYRRGAETVHALAGVSLTVNGGEMVAVVGRSGSGKTTLLNQIGCLDTPTSGAVRVCGVEISRLPERDLAVFRRDHIGFMFQLFYLIPTLTAAENVELPMIFAGERDRRRRAREALERVGLHRFDALPHEMDGGDMQRVAIARAIVRRPRLLLADEPTGRLETASRAAILDIFRALRDDGLAVVIVTHDPALAAATGRVVELADGRVAAETTAAQEAFAE